MPVAEPRALQQQIQHILQAGIDANQTRGTAAIICNSAGKLIESAAGFADDNATPMTVDTALAIMSLTKGITGVACMQLVERGQLSLDDLAGKFCPWLTEVKVLQGTNPDGSYRFRDPASPITIQHLLTHTSGLTYTVWNKDVADWANHPDTTGPGDRNSITSIQLPLAFDPGTSWAYGVGMDWAGLVVEAVTGVSLEEYFRTNILDPLGMNNTSFKATPRMKAGSMRCYHRTPEGGLVPGNNAVTAESHREFDGGGGDLLGTAADYARFLSMMLGRGQLDGTRILAEETVALMSENHIGAHRVTPMASEVAAISNTAEFFPGDEKSWAITFQRNEQPSYTGRPAGTLMWAGLMNCYYWIDLTNDIAGVYVSQVLPFADPLCLQQYYDIESATYQHLQ